MNTQPNTVRTPVRWTLAARTRYLRSGGKLALQTARLANQRSVTEQFPIALAVGDEVWDGQGHYHPVRALRPANRRETAAYAKQAKP